MNDDTFLHWRAARCVFSTTPGTVTDNVSFAGVTGSKALLLPTLVDPVAGVASREAGPPGDYILWVTNTSPAQEPRGGGSRLCGSTGPNWGETST
ncbi:MAG: hypothetical protein WDN45_17350 [Caulobacteraceae bacterium]